MADYKKLSRPEISPMLQLKNVVDCGANGLTRPRFQMGFFWPVWSHLEAELSTKSFFITSKTQYLRTRGFFRSHVEGRPRALWVGVGWERDTPPKYWAVQLSTWNKAEAFPTACWSIIITEDANTSR